jgi:putative flippase GtrA
MTSRRDGPSTAPTGALARLADLWDRPGVRRFSKYAVGSVVAFGASNLAFLLLYGLGWTSPQVASVLAFAAGIPVNYVLNRRWAWQRRGRPALRGELLPYSAVVALSVVSSAAGTWAVDRWLQSADLPRAVEVLLVDATFIAINGGLFLAKYVLLDRLVFRYPPTAPPGDPGVPADVERVP